MRLNRGHLRLAVTLIDSIAAIVILSVGLVPLVRTFAESAQDSITPSYATAAGFLATERMEQIVARSCTAGGYNQVTTANFPNETPVSGYTRYNRSVSITEVATDLATPQAGSGLKKVVVTVSWSSGTKQAVATRLFVNF